MKIFHKLVSSDEAKEIISQEISKRIVFEDRKISDSAGYVSAEDVFSKYDIPPFDRSEVDGYAVFHSDVEGSEEDNPHRLKLIGSVAAGDRSAPSLGTGSCVYVATGAIIPRGADAVVMVEDTRASGQTVEVFRSVYPGENISYSGTDISLGDLILKAGTRISPEAIGALAAAGIDRVKVYKKMKIAILSTGNEVIEPGNELKYGEIFDTNSNYFVAKLATTGLIDPEFIGIARDNEDELSKLVNDGLKKYDAIMPPGSTSAGFYDMLYKIVEELGGEILFHGINIKPGKPTFFGLISGHPFFGMPGFPLSSAVVLNYIVIPGFLSAYGIEHDNSIEVKVPFRINAEKLQETIYPAVLTKKGYGFPIMGNSGSISRMLYADGLMVIPGDEKYVSRDEKVKFYKFDVPQAKIICIGSSDPLLDEVILETDKSAKIVNVGAWGGISAIKAGEADVSGIHILKNGVYNISVYDNDLRNVSYLVRGYLRNRGFVSKTGVSSFQEILDKGMVFVNRNKGSGTRDLIEELIGNNESIRKNMKGYLWETNTEAGVARAVEQGRADAGITLEYYAIKLGLKYTHINKENYDILISKEFYDSEYGQAFIKNLKGLKDRIKNYPGYSVPDDIGEIIS